MSATAQAKTAASQDTFVKLTVGDYTLELCPSVGGCITEFSRAVNGKRVDILRAYDRKEELSSLNFSSFPMTPQSNRISYCNLHFKGETFIVGPARGGEPHSNHGDGWTSSWTVKSQSANNVILSLKTSPREDSPYVYEAEQSFTINGDALTVDMTIKNLSGRELPFGTGQHPYFNDPTDIILKANYTHVWNSKGMVPTELVPVPDAWNFAAGKNLTPSNLGPTGHGGDGSAHLDHCFANGDPKMEITMPKRGVKVTMTGSEEFKHAVIFVPPQEKGFCCIELVTNATDGANLMAKGRTDTGIITLKHGESFTCRTTFKCELI